MEFAHGRARLRFTGWATWVRRLTETVMLMLALTASIASAAGSSAGSSVQAQKLGAVTVTPLSQIGGLGARGIAARAGRVHMGVGSQLVVVDASNPSAPRRLGTMKLPTPPLDVALSGDWALVADGRAGLRVVDMRDPAMPREVAAVDVGGRARALAVHDGHAYVVTGGARLVVIDLANPAQPRVLAATAAQDNTSAEDVAVTGSTVFVAQTDGLRSYDVSDPATPRPLGLLSYGSYPRALVVDGPRAFVGFGDVLWTVDVGDPAAMQHDEKDTLWDIPSFGLALSGSTLVGVAGGFYEAEGKAVVLDISNPSQPTVAGRLTGVVQHGWDIALDGGMAYVGGQGGLLQSVEVAEPMAPQTESMLDLSEGTWCAGQIAVADGMAYVACATHFTSVAQVNVVDVRDPTRPRWLGPLTDLGFRVAALGDLAVVSDPERSEFHFLNVHDPSAPATTSRLPSMGIPRDTALRGNMAYLVGDSSGVPDVIPDGLRLIDVADPMHPAQLRTVFLNDEPHRVVLAGDNVLVLDLAGMKVIDVSEPATAHVMGKYAVPALGDPDAPFVVGGVDVAIAGDIAYLMADTLRILDLSRPSQPRTLSMIGPPGCCGWEVSLSGRLLFETLDDGLHILDVGNPLHPYELGVYRTLGTPAGVVTVGDLAYVADGANGLAILRVTVEEADLPRIRSGTWEAFLPRLTTP